MHIEAERAAAERVALCSCTLASPGIEVASQENVLKHLRISNIAQ